MNPPKNMVRIIGGRRYSTATATLLAADDYWDGHNHERRGRNRFLYRTPNGRYFTVTLTQWQGERDSLEPVPQEDAVALYEGPLSEHYETHAEAFPGVEVVDA
ncbi:MAG: hypothetical protein H3C30_04145 [Candidatus Hydrogenedentes bacterium]|nr:hypothetical protein [Candidatus Hydrogenedentota bacterium]